MIEFSLGEGTYATSILREIGDFTEARIDDVRKS